jgi:hypothetical protein
MAISRGQMRRQLRKSGGIMDVTPRENFGIGSSLKKFTRKIIPNEIADIAVKAAPFVAPFNPAAAAAMAGLGGFDQTGSISDSLKSAALTYGGGQLARYAGGAGFQQNPFTQGGAFRGGLEGFKSGFSSPFGTETGIGKMLSDRAAAKGKALKVEGITGIDESITADAAPVKSAVVDSSITADAPAVVSELTSKSVVRNDPSIFNLVKEGEYGQALVEGAKKFGKAVFTNKDGSLDKNALLAAGSFGLTYLDAKRIANEAGEDITVEEYDEAAKAEKQEEYKGYLQNFFGGKADGGRIKAAGGYKPISFSRQEKSYLFRRLGGSGGSDRSYTMPNLYKILNNPGSYPDDAAVLKEIAIMGLGKKDGGRIGFESGANKQIAIENAMSELRKKYPELSEDNLFSLVLNGFGAKSEEKELPAPSIKIDNNMDDLPRGLQIDTTTSAYGDAGKGRPVPEFLKETTPEKEAAEIAKIIMGTLGENDDLGMRSREFIYESVVIPRRKELMERFDISMPDADNLIRDAMEPYRIKRFMGGEVPVRKNQGGVMELDYRESGGFVPVGIKEKADDVPAMLSKNEFVLTADAVRGIGNGDVEKGAEKLYGIMKQAEKVGQA